MARDSFTTFIPLSVDSDARTKIIFDFFELLSAIAAHGKTNGLGGRKLSRLAGWWSFDHGDDGNGFEGGYKKWTTYGHGNDFLIYRKTDICIGPLMPLAICSSPISDHCPQSQSKG
jgi:hypothetical protein